MASIQAIILVALFSCCTAQLAPVPGFFNVPASAFNTGGTVNFAGSSLSDVCRRLMLFGGKEALSDGMGAAAKWFSTQRISGQVAGGTDPQMQCLYNQATGSMIPGMVGARDPGNMFGDYFDTVIEYPMILDPCSNPQCNGKVNPTVLLMQAFAPMMRPGMGGGMGGMGGGMGGMGGANPFLSMMGHGHGMQQNPLLAATLPGVNGMQTSKGTATQPASPPANPAGSTPPVSPKPAVQPAMPNNLAQMMQMFQNPQMAQMMQQYMLKTLMGQGGGQPAATPAPKANQFPNFGGSQGFPFF